MMKSSAPAFVPIGENLMPVTRSSATPSAPEAPGMPDLSTPLTSDEVRRRADALRSLATIADETDAATDWDDAARAMDAERPERPVFVAALRGGPCPE
jgi:hypothetical protein